MKLSSIEINDYLPFKFSQIDNLYIEFHSDIQIIIGSNGSGKSSLLRELSLRPSTRSDYGENGYKKLELDYNNSSYVITSDFTSRKSPHSFVKDGHELNEGGTTSIQESLISQYLDYNKLHDQLLRGHYLLSSLQPSIRKSLLMDLSPFNLTFILDHHKRILSKIRNHKATLTHLNERKLTLEQEFITDETHQSLSEEKQEKQKLLYKAIEYIHRLEEIIRSIKEESFKDYNTLTQELKMIKEDIPSLINIDSETPLDQLTEINKLVSQLKQQRSSEESIIHTLLDEITLYDTNLEDIKNKRDKSVIQEDIDNLKNKIETFKHYSLTDPFPDHLHDEFKIIVDDLYKHAHELIHATHLLSNKIYNRKIRQLDTRKRERDHLLHQKSLIEQDIGSIPSSIEKEDLPKNNCSRELCPLWNMFMDSYDRRKIKKDNLLKRLSTINHKLNRRTIFIDKTSELLHQFSLCLPCLKVIYQHLTNYPQLKLSLSDDDILQKLKINPLAFIRDIDRELEVSKCIYLREKYTKELGVKLEELNHITSLNKSDTDLIKTLRDKKYNQLIEKRSLVTDINKKLNFNLSLLKRLEDYIKLKERVSILYDDFKTLCLNAPIQYEKDYLLKVKDILITIRDDYTSRLGYIDNVFKQQDILKARYQEEIITQIDYKVKEKTELELIEKALSPFTGIPHKTMTHFMNHLIDKMNNLISTVFTYPFELCYLDIENPLTYKFPVMVDHVYIDDISSGSEAQKEMVDLAFILALMEILNLDHYPLILDEIGKNFDHRHRQNLLYLFQDILERNVIQSLIIVNHNKTIYSGLGGSVICLSESNILTPPIYNTHVKIKHKG